MLKPQELKNYKFTHAIRGYSVAEVDEYIDFLCERYEEVYREKNELEQKLIAALRILDERKNSGVTAPAAEADAFAGVVGDAQAKAEEILAEAEAQKAQILAEAEAYAGRLGAEADAAAAKQAELFAQMRRAVLDFRDELYARYSRQIDQIEELAEVAEKCAFPAEVETVFSAQEPEEDAAIAAVPTEAEEAQEIPEPAGAEDADPFGGVSAEDDDDDMIIVVEPAKRVPAEEEKFDNSEEIAETEEVLLFFEDFTKKKTDDADSDTDAGNGEDAGADEEDEPEENAEAILKQDRDAFDAVMISEPKADADLDAIFRELIQADTDGETAEKREKTSGPEDGLAEKEEDEVDSGASDEMLSEFFSAEEAAVLSDDGQDEAELPDNEETDAPAEEESDDGMDDEVDALLKNLREAFDIGFESEVEEDSGEEDEAEAPEKSSGKPFGKAAKTKKAEEVDDFAFLPEITEDSEESDLFLHITDTKKKPADSREGQDGSGSGTGAR